MIKTRYKIQEYFSKETKIHCNRVEQYTKAMAEELGLSAYDTKMLTVAARYHDIGKYYIPEKILNAPRPLTGLERKVIDMHAYYGYEACMEFGFGKDICELILLHHGTHKYRTLTDEQISDFAKEYFQILMAADIYDALISDRVYRRAMDHDRALDIVAENPEIKRWVFLALWALACGVEWSFSQLRKMEFHSTYNHPLCGCASIVIQKNYLSVYNKVVQAIL